MKEFIFEPRNIYYRTNEFRAGRPTLVFVHGLAGSSSTWSPYEVEFLDTFNILTFDLRGHGMSGKLPNYEDYKIENFADDLNELTSYLNLDNFVLIGHSLGSLVVLSFLQKYQEKVLRVIFFAPNFSGNVMLTAKLTAPLLWLSTSLLKRFPFKGRDGVGHVDYSLHSNSGDWNIKRMIADLRITSFRVYLYATRQAYYFEAEDFLKNIYIPTLIIHGERDTIFPVQYGIFMAGKIPGAKLVLFENANHVLVLNNIEDIIKEINKFVLDYIV